MSAQHGEPTDERLIQSTLAGDDEAFASLVARHKRRIFGIAARFTRSEAELDDLCQEIFIKAYRQLGKFRSEAPFEHWLSRVGVRTCYDHLRKTRHDRDAVALDDMELPSTDNIEPRRAREVLDFAMAKLGPEERLVITLLELEERTVREIAGLTGWSESNVKVRAFRARQSLKNILEAHHER
ncbi:MAG: sigma-70 family RNA polymerase sigma factor [Verrucomicrobia bacterium]|nr:sigma-70 family RNA polymerase sigma factor [Verrucomicrobiota bacterium]